MRVIIIKFLNSIDLIINEWQESIMILINMKINYRGLKKRDAWISSKAHYKEFLFDWNLLGRILFQSNSLYLIFI